MYYSASSCERDIVAVVVWVGYDIALTTSQEVSLCFWKVTRSTHSLFRSADWRDVEVPHIDTWNCGIHTYIISYYRRRLTSIPSLMYFVTRYFGFIFLVWVHNSVEINCDFGLTVGNGRYNAFSTPSAMPTRCGILSADHHILMIAIISNRNTLLS